jgi:hypothetical protein
MTRGKRLMAFSMVFVIGKLKAHDRQRIDWEDFSDRAGVYTMI